MKYFLLLFLAGCSTSFLSSAEANCEAFHASMDGAGERCSQPDPYFPGECGGIIEFSKNSDHVGDCRARLDQQPCAVFGTDVNGWDESCRVVVFNP